MPSVTSAAAVQIHIFSKKVKFSNNRVLFLN